MRKQAAAAHRDQSRALLLCRLGRVREYTPSPYSSQNTTLTHAASTDWIEAAVSESTDWNGADVSIVGFFLFLVVGNDLILL